MNELMSANAGAMTSREIASIAGKRHDNVMRVCRDLRNTGVCPQIEETPYIEPTNGQTYLQCLVNERDSYVVMARLSPEFTGRLVDRWRDLESGKAAPMAVATTRAAEDVAVLSALADALRLEGSARLGVMRKGMEIVAPHLLPAVPVYAIDAPNGSSSDIGSEPTASLSELLQEHAAGLSAAAANKRLESLGYLEQMQRPSSRGGVKKYWSVTKAGTKYGKNATSDRNQRETQPVWYKATAAAMMQEIKSA